MYCNLISIYITCTRGKWSMYVKATMRQNHIEKANNYCDFQCKSTLSEFSPVTEQNARKCYES